MKSNSTMNDADRLPAYKDNIPETFEIGFAPQTDWEAKESMTFFFGGVGTGAYIVSQFFNHIPGLILGFLLVVVGKNIGHLLSSSRPQYAFRAFANIRRSWISKGATCILCFGVFGCLDILTRLGWIDADKFPVAVFSIMAFLTAFVVMAYPGFLMAESRSIPLWNTPLIPITLVSYSLAFGVSLIALLLPFTGAGDSLLTVTKVQLVLVAATLFLVLTHLMVMQYSGKAARRSAALLLKGNLKSKFVFGVIGAGLVIPLTITGYLQTTGSQAVFGTFVAGFLILVGGYFYEKTLFQAAVFIPPIDIE